MTAFFLKLLACFSMLIDHAAFVFEPQLSAISPWLYAGCRMFGRLAFPLFALGIGEGTVHTSSPRKYLSRMFLFAVLAQIPYSLMLGTHHASLTLNVFGRAIPLYASCSVMVTLFLGLAICVSIHEGSHWGAAFALAAADFADCTIGMDYGLTGVLFIVALYLARANRLYRMLIVVLFSICLYIEPLKQVAEQIVAGADPIKLSTQVLYCGATMLSALFVLCYNKRRGPSAKLFIYFFYPVHMLVLWVMWLFSGK